MDKKASWISMNCSIIDWIIDDLASRTFFVAWTVFIMNALFYDISNYFFLVFEEKIHDCSGIGYDVIRL